MVPSGCRNGGDRVVAQLAFLRRRLLSETLLQWADQQYVVGEITALMAYLRTGSREHHGTKERKNDDAKFE
eukprot:12914143-Prorocentrum_lima.AAC.1